MYYNIIAFPWAAQSRLPLRPDLIWFRTAYPRLFTFIPFRELTKKHRYLTVLIVVR